MSYLRRKWTYFQPPHLSHLCLESRSKFSGVWGCELNFPSGPHLGLMEMTLIQPPVISSVNVTEHGKKSLKPSEGLHRGHSTGSREGRRGHWANTPGPWDWGSFCWDRVSSVEGTSRGAQAHGDRGSQGRTASRQRCPAVPVTARTLGPQTQLLVLRAEPQSTACDVATGSPQGGHLNVTGRVRKSVGLERDTPGSHPCLPGSEPAHSAGLSVARGQ